MLLASMSIAVHIALVTVPVAAYFLVLGLLNSRSTPRLLTARQDFALLVGSLAPLLMLPAQRLVGSNPWGWIGILGGGIAFAVLLAPRPGRWVVYNISPRQARRLLDTSIERALPSQPAGWEQRVRIRDFALLRNVTIEVDGLDPSAQQALHRALGEQLEATEALPHPMAAAMLLVAVFMLCAPLAMVAREAPQIVRLITSLF